MKIGTFRRLNKADYPEAPPWMEKIFDSINEQVESISTAIQGQLSFADNVYSETRRITMTHNVVTELTLQTVKKPFGCLFVHADYFEFGDFIWERGGEQKIKLRAKWDVDPGRPVNVTLLFFGA